MADAAQPFLSDVTSLRARARQHVAEGQKSSSYGGDAAAAIDILQAVLATEIVCVLRYKYHYYMATGIHSKGIAAEFLEHANEEQGHADLIAQRITQLDGKPNLSPEGLLSRSHSEYVEGQDVVEMIEEDLVAERIAIDSYREIIQYLGNDDPTTRRMMEEILAKEEEHAEDLGNLLQELGKKGEPNAEPLKKGASRG